MKKIFKIILKYYLKIITKIVIFVHRPIIIAISGSVNKSFVRDEIKRVLEESGESVRANPKNFNTEIGLPLAILNISSGYNSYRRWLPVLRDAFLAIFQKDFPKYLVLELGVSQKGDMKYLLSIVRPQIVIVTEITQRYIESFSGMDKLVGEYIYLAKNIKKNGRLILNWDNNRIRSLRKHSKVPVLYFSKKSRKSDIFIENIKKEIDGISVDFVYKNKENQLKIKRFGDHHAVAATVGMMVENIFSK
jgi:UDP-N-acetylmuramoyl-tripeptide--D-alanyl-D-alanine ligase